MEGEVYATRVICSLTKTELHNEEIGADDLPSNTTKREMYELYCFNRGWTVKSNNKGRYPNVVDYTQRKVDEMLWQGYMESFEVCSWCSFRNIWKEHCSNIRICSPCNDTYGKCKIFCNAFCYRSSKVGMVDNDVSDGEPTSEAKPASDDEDTSEVKHFWKRLTSILLLPMMLNVLICASSKNRSLKPLGSIFPRKKECVATSKRQRNTPLNAATMKCRTRTAAMWLFEIMHKTCRCRITAASSPEQSIISPP
jgi:hypothetical protein